MNEILNFLVKIACDMFEIVASAAAVIVAFFVLIKALEFLAKLLPTEYTATYRGRGSQRQHYSNWK